MYARRWIGAIAVASLGLMACGGDDGGKDDRASGEEPDALGTLEVAKVGAVAPVVDDAVVTGAGIVAVSKGALVLIDPATALVTKEAAATTDQVLAVVALDDGTPFALVDGADCAWAKVDPAALTWGTPMPVASQDCNADVVLIGSRAYQLVREDGTGPAGEPIVTPGVTQIDLLTGASSLEDIAAVTEGYDIPAGRGIRARGDELLVPLSAADDENAAWVLPVGAPLEVGVPVVRQELAEDHFATGEVILGRSVQVDGRIWGAALGEEGQPPVIGAWDATTGTSLGTVALPDLGVVVAVAATDDAAFVIATSEDGTTTNLYRVS